MDTDSDESEEYYAITDFNSPNDHGNVPLHIAVQEDSIEKLDFLLKQPNIDVNYKNDKGKTPLSMSISMYRSDSLILKLLEANADPNIADNYKQSPLHDAVTRPTTDVAQELIKKGADVNAQNKDLCTPLHCAIIYSNLEAVSMLLYYEADTNILCKRNMTALMKAFIYNVKDAAEILINYFYPKQYPATSSDSDIMHLASRRQSHLAVKLVEAGADVNYVTPSGETVLAFTFYYDSGTLFKLIWPQFNYETLLNNPRPFLLSYLEHCRFPAADWVECLRLILESSVAISFLNHYNKYVLSENMKRYSFFQVLLRNFYERKVELEDRLSIIYIALSLDVKVYFDDVTTAYGIFGFNEELEIFIYFVHDCSNLVMDYYGINNFLIPFILACDDKFSIKPCTNEHSFYDVLLSITSCIDVQADNIFNGVSFFSKSIYKKLSKNMAFSSLRIPEFYEKLKVIPEIPTLLELSRNEARNFIKQTYKVTKPYQFHDAVKQLNLPQRIVDIIRFKTPLY